MGKKGGKKKEGKKKEENQEEKEVLSEVDKEFFLIQINDLQAKVSRLKARCGELELSNEKYQHSYEKLDEDRADIIAYLERVVKKRTDEISELEQRLEGVQETREAEINSYEEKIYKLNDEYKKMHDELSSEIQMLQGKLHALEEFRQQKEELMAKFANLEKELEEQHTKHEAKVYNLDRNFTISKERMKKDMEAKLMQLATEFQNKAHTQMAAATHRTVRENIAVNNEFEILVDQSASLAEENMRLKRRYQEQKNEIEILESLQDEMREKSVVQCKVIQRLTQEIESLKDEIEIFKDTEAMCARYKEEIRQGKEDFQFALQQLHETQRMIQDKEATIDTLYKRNSFLADRNENLENCLSSAVMAVREAIEVQCEPSEDEAEILAKRKTLLRKLLDLLDLYHKDAEETQNVLPSQKPSISSEPLGQFTYLRGDLGFISKTPL